MEAIFTATDDDGAASSAVQVKAEGRANPLLQLLADDPLFAPIKDKLGELMDPARFIGRAAEQVDEFLAGEVEPRLQGVELAGGEDELRV